MIFSWPPQFGQCAMSISNTRFSSLAQLSRTGRWCAQVASHSAGGAAWVWAPAPSQGVLPAGFRSMRLDSLDGSLLTETAVANSPDALATGLSSVDLPAKLWVGMFVDTPQLQLEKRDEKTVLVPPGEAGAITRLQFEVRPTFRVLTLRVKARVALPVLLEPGFKLAHELPPSFDVTLLLYTGKSTIRQIV